MTILQREHSPDGILIPLEDWSCEYKAAKNATIALYPVAQNNICNNGRTYPKKGKLFRVSFDFESAAEAQSAFFSIISGKKNILDYLNKYSSETIRKEDFLKALKKEIKPGASAPGFCFWKNFLFYLYQNKLSKKGVTKYTF